MTLSGGALFASWKLLQFPSSLIVKVILAIFTRASAQQIYYCSQIYAQKPLPCNNQTHLQKWCRRLPTQNINICPTLLTMFMLIPKDVLFFANNLPSNFSLFGFMPKKLTKNTKSFAHMFPFPYLFVKSSALTFLCLAFPLVQHLLYLLILLFSFPCLFTTFFSFHSLPATKKITMMSFILLLRLLPTAISFWIHRISFDLRS